MNIYDKINNLYNNGGNLPPNRPAWVDEILDELKSIKASLEANNVQIRKVDKTFMDFVNDFRKKMRADTTKNIYPEIIHNGRVLGISFKGYLYDKSTLKILATNEAFEIYRELYSNQNKQ